MIARGPPHGVAMEKGSEMDGPPWAAPWDRRADRLDLRHNAHRARYFCGADAKSQKRFAVDRSRRSGSATTTAKHTANGCSTPTAWILRADREHTTVKQIWILHTYGRQRRTRLILP